MTINPTAEEVELEQAEAIDVTAKYKALGELVDKDSFKTLVLDGYLKDEAVRLTSLLAANGMQSHRPQIFEALTAISHFEQYLETVDILGSSAAMDAQEE